MRLTTELDKKRGCILRNRKEKKKNDGTKETKKQQKKNSVGTSTAYRKIHRPQSRPLPLSTYCNVFETKAIDSYHDYHVYHYHYFENNSKASKIITKQKDHK